MSLFSRLVKVGTAAIKAKAKDFLDPDESADIDDTVVEEMAKSRVRAKRRRKAESSTEPQSSQTQASTPLQSPPTVQGRDVQVTERDGKKRSL